MRGRETVGNPRRGANLVGEAVGGRQAASSETSRGSLPVTSTSISSATRLGSTGCEAPTDGSRSAVGAGRFGGAYSGREGRRVLARYHCQTISARGTRPRTAHSRHTHFDHRKACPVVGRETGGFAGWSGLVTGSACWRLQPTERSHPSSGNHPRASRRVVLVPQSPGGTPVSVQDLQDPTPSVTDLPTRGPVFETQWSCQ